MPQLEITLAMTGASGALYWYKLLHCMVKADVKVSLLFSTAGLIVLNSELDINVPSNPIKATQILTSHFDAKDDQLIVYGKDQWSSPVASGRSGPKSMVVCPCTTGCLSAIAHGTSDNLLERAADVIIKEGGKLILMVREMPLSPIHLKNMLELSQIGVCIMPPNPGFYFHPKSIDDIVDFVVAKALDQLSVPHEIGLKWDKEYL